MRASTLIPAVSILLAAAAPLGAQVSDFTWIFQGNPGGSGQVVGETLVVVGADDGQTSLGNVSWMQTTAPAPLHVTVMCSYVNNDDGEHDAPAYVVDGVATTPDTGGFWGTGDYFMSFDVQAGHTFGFGIWTADAIAGEGVGTFHDLVVTASTWDDVGGGIDPRPLYDVSLASVDFSTQPVGLCGLGDVDGDGVRELVIAHAQPDGLLVVSGADGATLYSLPAPHSVHYGPALADAGDVDADGVPDFVLGRAGSGLAPQGGRVEVRSGLDGALIFGVDGAGEWDQLGSSVAGLGDVDGDGFDDVAAGAAQLSGNPETGYVLVLGGPDGHLLYELDGPLLLGQFGLAVAAIDDVDGDGVSELAVAEPRVTPAHVYVHSGATGALLSTATTPTFAFAARLANAGDFDGDGHGDYAWWQLATGPEAITVRSGTTGAKLAQWEATISPMPAQGLAGADFSGDGLVDVAFSVQELVPLGQASVVRVYSGAPGHPLLHEFTSAEGALGSGFGVMLSAFGDADLDGAADLAIGTPTASFNEPLHVVHALDGKGTPLLLGTGTLSAGSPTTLSLIHGKPSSPFLLLIGVALLEAPFKGGTLVPQPLLFVPAATNNDGRASFTAPWPAGIPGPFTFWSQAWFADGDGPQGFTASNGLSGTQP